MNKILALLLLFSGAAFAQPYPNKPIRMLVAFAPGGPVDIIARLVGPKLSEALGQPVVVENKLGASGNVATADVAKSAPDGYTLLAHSSAYAVNPTLFRNPGYDPKDLLPIAIVASQANLVLVNASFPARTLDELRQQLKSGKFGYASPGAGTTPHLTAENLFNVTSNLDVTAIHFRGAGPSAAAVVGGEPRIGAGAVSTPLPFVKSGKLRALAVSSSARIAALPDVPTFAEAGFPGVEDYTWIAAFLPAGTSPAIVQRLNEACNQALQSADMRERLVALAFEPVGGTSQQFSAYVKAEIAKWGKVVREGNIKAE